MALVFADLPRGYGDVKAEVIASRTRCALFDFSFLERARIEGPSAQPTLEAFASRSLATLAPGRIRYALRIAPGGAVLADLTIWRSGPQAYDLMSGRREDLLDLLSLSGPAARVTDLSTGTAILSLQGPRSLGALDGLGDLRAIAALPYFGFCHARLAGVPCTVGRLGYTGEPGFEIVLAPQDRASLWAELAKRAQPAGFAAADILRIEAGFALFTNEFAIPVSPSEAGLGCFCDRPAVSFPKPVRLVCFRAASDHKLSLWRPPAGLARPDRPGMIVATSACASVAADGVLGLGYVAAAEISREAPLQDPAGWFRDIQLVSLPFYDAHKRRPRQPWWR